MRTQVQRGTKPDTAILRGYEPEALPVRPQRTTPPVSGGAASPAAPAGAQEPLRRDAPVLTAPPAATLPPAAATPPAAAPSAAIALAPPPAAAPAPTAPPPGGGAQLIQVAASSDMVRGRDLQRQLRAAGFDAYWEIVRGDKGDVVRVRVAVDRATRNVDDTLAALRARGLQPVLVAP
jgi:cell division septation protein DedD